MQESIDVCFHRGLPSEGHVVPCRSTLQSPCFTPRGRACLRRLSPLWTRPCPCVAFHLRLLNRSIHFVLSSVVSGRGPVLSASGGLRCGRISIHLGVCVSQLFWGIFCIFKKLGHEMYITKSRGKKCISQKVWGKKCIIPQNKTLFIERGRNAFSFGKRGKNAINPFFQNHKSNEFHRTQRL